MTAADIEREGRLSDMETLQAEKRELRAEIERLKAWTVDERMKRHKTVEDVMSARTEIERLTKLHVAAAVRAEVAQIDNERLRAALEEIEFHGGPAAAAARTALEPKP